jgi:hypothetical protein
MPMSLRAAIVGLIVLATVGFVVGTTIERNSQESHAERPAAARPETSSTSAAERGAESESTHAAERHEPGGQEAHGEFQPFGIDIEAVAFIVLAAVASLGMAAAVWTRPRSRSVLGGVAVAMVLFAALDVREIFHQVDESRTGLAVLAVIVATLHVAAAGLIALLARSDHRLTGATGAMPV